MKNLRFLYIFLPLALILFNGCSSSNEENEPITKASIYLKNASNQPVPNIVVYAYDQDTWTTIGHNPLFADAQAASDANGLARFENLNFPNAFTELNNYTNTIRFAVNYVLNGQNRTKNIAITFTRGEDKSGTIILN